MDNDEDLKDVQILPIEGEPKTELALTTNRIYLVLEGTKDEEGETSGFNFEIYDRLEHTPENMLILCLLRGMISMALNRTEEVVDLGATCFQQDSGDAENEFPFGIMGNA